MFDGGVLRISIPVQDVERARKYYAETLKLTFVGEDKRGITFRSEGVLILLAHSKSFWRRKSALLTWIVDDIVSVVERMQANGVVFERYALPDVEMADGIATIDGEQIAWFKDSEGNMLAVTQLAESE